MKVLKTHRLPDDFHHGGPEMLGMQELLQDQEERLAPTLYEPTEAASSCLLSFQTVWHRKVNLVIIDNCSFLRCLLDHTNFNVEDELSSLL